MKLSLVISVFNEEENIRPLIERIDDSLKGLDYEVIFVDDGSKDKTLDQIRELGDSHYTTVSFNKNFGQKEAM